MGEDQGDSPPSGRMTMKTLRHWIRSLAPWCVALTLIGCSASQQTSVPTPPEPPTAPPTEPPTTPSSPTMDTGGFEATPTTPSPAEAPSAEAPSLPEPAIESGDETDAAGEEAEVGGEAEAEASAEASAAGAPAGGAETSEERRAGLDGKLDESLREFDGLILKEQEILDERREETAANTGGGGGGSEDADVDAASQEQPTEKAGGTGGSPDAPSEDSAPASPGGTIDGDPAATDDNGRIPSDVGDGRDDDIVARQLREAAMQEKDPALRERLWDEYRTYKSGTR